MFFPSPSPLTSVEINDPLNVIAMGAGKLETGIIFLLQTGVGILGNSSLLCFYNISFFIGHKLRSTDLILNQLAFANSLVLFFKGIPQTIVAFGWKDFLDDVGCKLAIYWCRVGMAVSLNTICLLNGFQLIKLNPGIWSWMEVKIRSLKFIVFCCFLCWILHIVLNSFIPVLVSSPRGRQNLSLESNYRYCFWEMPDHYNPLYTVLLYYSPDFLGLAFIMWASISMVILLHRHKKQVQYIHNQALSKSRQNHEARATRTILILVTSFFAFYSIYNALTIWTTLTVKTSYWTMNSSVFLSTCFPALSPFVIIISDTRISRLCFGCCLKTKCLSD